MEFQEETTQKIVSFLREIGLEVKAGVLDESTFLPGMEMCCGTLIVDESKLKHPGDLLHEAGHLAVKRGETRQEASGSANIEDYEEMAAIAWSYAALLHLGLEPEVVFHPQGYKGGAQSIIDNFGAGHYFGVPILQWLGLTAEPRLAHEMGVPPYPHMLAWLAA
jgi:hypothetical protein